MKYHNSESGPKLCTASKRPCPVGGEHYATRELAELAYGKSFEKLPTHQRRSLKPEVNFKQYVARMDSVTDKSLLLKYLPSEGKLLDFGSGSGAIAGNFAPERYTGYDLSPEMCEEASKQHPGYRFTTELGREKFSAAVYCSVMHEIYSYSGYSKAVVVAALKTAREHLEPGGCVVIREGVRALPPGELSLKLRDEADASKFLKHLQEHSQQEYPVKIERGELKGEGNAVADFLNVYTWGWKSVEREMDERVNFASQGEWQEMLEEAGFQVEASDLYSQDDYFVHLGELVDIGSRRWPTKVFLKATPV